MLKRIKLSNWRSHKDSEIVFKEGANLFLGNMGSGKSSIVDALCFALYGTYPKLGRRDVKLEEVRNFRNSDGQVSVEVEWEDDGGGEGGREYKVRREVFPPNAWIYCDGKMVCKGAKAATEEVEQILQIPYELFARAVYAEQNRLDYWLTLAAGARKAELDRLLGLDKFEKVRAKATTEINKLKDRAEEAEKDAPLEKFEEARKEVEAGKEKISRQKEEIERVGKEKGEVRKEFEEVQKEYLEMEEMRKKCKEMEEKRREIVGAVSNLRKNIDESRDVPELGEAEKREKEAGEKRGELEEKLKEVQKGEKEISVLIGRMETQVKNEKNKAGKRVELEKKQKEILKGKSLEELRGEISKMQEEMRARISESAGIDSQIKDLEKVLVALQVRPESEEGSVCPVCRQGLDEKRREELEKENMERKKELEEKAGGIGEVISENKKKDSELSAVDAEAGRLETQIGALGKEEDVGLMEKELEEKGEELQKVADEGNEITLELKEVEKEENEIRKVKGIIEQTGRWTKELGEKEKESGEIGKKLEEIGFSDEKFREVGGRREGVMEKKTKLEERERAGEEILKNFEQTLAMLEKNFKEVKKKREEAGKIREEIDRLNLFKEVLVATQAQLRGRLISEINLAMQKLWPLVYPYGDWSKVRVIAGEKDYDVQIFQGEWKNLEAHASGGERACLGLCLRAALSILLTPQLGWLILDEPTHNLDENAVQTLGKAISEKMPQIIPQLIVITHEPRLLESTPARVFKFSRDKLKGEDTKVEMEG
ncbi:MAG: AAA family ATPase [Candidatus Micrarchaeota archaeon]